MFRFSILDSSTSMNRYMMMMILLCSCIRRRSTRRYIMLEFRSYSILPSVVVIFEQGGLCYYVCYLYWSVFILLKLTYFSNGEGYANLLIQTNNYICYYYSWSILPDVVSYYFDLISMIHDWWYVRHMLVMILLHDTFYQ